MIFSRLLSLATTLVLAIASSTGDSVQLFIDNIDPNAAWAASIQNACNGSTTYVVSCTSAPNECNIQTATITEGADFFIITTPAIYSETSATITESCALNTASSSASCNQIIMANGYGNAIQTTVDKNLTGTSYYQYDVAITAGAKHTKDGGSCLAHVNGAPRGGGMEGIMLIGTVVMAGVCGILLL